MPFDALSNTRAQFERAEVSGDLSESRYQVNLRLRKLRTTGYLPWEYVAFAHR
jgi:hypothetical protein